MTRGIDKVKIDCAFLDKRSKLLPCQKERIVALYAGGGYSHMALSKMFNVSRRLIQFILDPEKMKQNLIARDQRGGTKIYYDKENHRQTTQRTRDRKRSLFNNKPQPPSDEQQPES